MNSEVTTGAASSKYLMCHFCSQVIQLEDPSASNIICDRCGHKNHKFNHKSAQMTLVFSLTALILYFPANMFPFMTIDMYGNRSSTTIWGGIVSLANSGDWVIAIVVFLASLLIPFIKLLILFYLSLTTKSGRHSHFKTKLYHFVEAIGRWSMLDIFLLAILIAIMKMQAKASVEPGVGAILFLFVVIFTIIASTYFDPKLLWKDKNEKLN